VHFSIDHHYNVGYDHQAGGKRPMIAYSRGSKRPAGAASLRNRMPALSGFFCRHKEIAQLAEHQLDTLRVAGSNPVF
jgi:hypothetical protein